MTADRAVAREAVADIERAVTDIVGWTVRNDVQQEIMSRAECALPRGTVWLLAHLARAGPVRLSAVATALGVDKSTLTPQAQRLERDGFVVREADPDDGRAALLRVSRAGRALLARLHSARSAMFARLLADWSPAEQADAAQVLTRLASGCLTTSAATARPA